MGYSSPISHIPLGAPEDYLQTDTGVPPLPQGELITLSPKHDAKLLTLHHINTMKIPQIISNPPDWLAVIFCLVGASIYLVTLIVLKNLLH